MLIVSMLTIMGADSGFCKGSVGHGMHYQFDMAVSEKCFLPLFEWMANSYSVRYKIYAI
jgi:hypothetical protein